VRFGLRTTAARARHDAVSAERAGFDVVWVDDGACNGAAVAASLAAHTSGIRVVIGARVGDAHPIELAEEVAVADLALGGRTVLAVSPAEGAVDRLSESLDLLLEAFGSHPFRHPGPHWPAPANLAGNVFNLEQRIRVTPPPAQLELPVWVVGAAGRSAANDRALGVVFDVDEAVDEIRAWWRATSTSSPAQVRRMRRSLLWSPTIDGGRLALAAAVDELRELRDAGDLDLVVVDVPTGHGGELADDQLDDLLDDISREVRPRLQLDRLPPGLDEHWVEHRSHHEQHHPEGGHHG
jgi:alkanesulfonate monooxygenase SsuD/methylene tetrahydromethanopterin reductase-like flavin-dependent oxidoreductase (luciferase family)